MKGPAGLSRPRTAASACRPISCRGSGTSATGHAGRGGASATGAAGIRARQAVQPGAEAGRYAADERGAGGARRSAFVACDTTGQGLVRLAQAETVATDSGIASDAPGVAADAVRSQPTSAAATALIAGRVRKRRPFPRAQTATDVTTTAAPRTDRRGHRAGPDCCARQRHRACDRAGGPAARPPSRAGHDLDRYTAVPPRRRATRPPRPASPSGPRSIRMN